MSESFWSRLYWGNWISYHSNNNTSGCVILLLCCYLDFMLFWGHCYFAFAILSLLSLIWPCVILAFLHLLSFLSSFPVPQPPMVCSAASPWPTGRSRHSAGIEPRNLCNPWSKLWTIPSIQILGPAWKREWLWLLNILIANCLNLFYHYTTSCLGYCLKI